MDLPATWPIMNREQGVVGARQGMSEKCQPDSMGATSPCSMSHERRHFAPDFWTVITLCASVFVPQFARAQGSADDFFAAPTWVPTTDAAVEQKLETWLRESDFDSATRGEVRAIWQQRDASAPMLDSVVACLAVVDSAAAQVVEQCTYEDVNLPPDMSWLASASHAPFIADNLRLYYARWLVQHGFFDEALAWTDGLRTADVVDPQALLFYRAVAHHRLVQPGEAEVLSAQILERADELPQRYRYLAQLIQKDVEGLAEDSLDHIARRMSDIRRRLAKGRAGSRVQEVENGVIESLDKLIDQIEKQQQQQMAQQGQMGGAPSGVPMSDSRLAELKGPGKVDRRDIGSGVDWGDLPPKEREQALQDIGREFPSHYQDVIQQYFRQLAEQSAGESP